MILLAIILLPLKYQFSALAKLRQFSHFSQQINKSEPFPFSIIQTRAPSLFPFVRCWNLHKSKTPIKYDWEGLKVWGGLSSFHLILIISTPWHCTDNYGTLFVWKRGCWTTNSFHTFLQNTIKKENISTQLMVWFTWTWWCTKFWFPWRCPTKRKTKQHWYYICSTKHYQQREHSNELSVCTRRRSWIQRWIFTAAARCSSKWNITIIFTFVAFFKRCSELSVVVIIVKVVLSLV